MQQDREGGRMDDDMQQQQDRRLKGMQGENQPPQQPQKCPRCDSLNTKFCYYNNYSLSQPRYFCKTCRRYWTQGGTLRNVPVGGGCRKGKRTKTSNSGENSNSRSQPPAAAAAAPMQQQAQQIVSTTATPALITSPALRKNEPTNLATLSAPPQSIAPMNSYYSGGGFLSSLAAIQSLNPPQGFNQSINVGGGGNFGGGSSNMALLQGFNVPTFSSQQQHQQIQQGEFFQMGTRDNKNIEVPFYPSHQEALIPPSRTASSHQADWHQGFINSTTNPTPSNPGLWRSIGGSSSTTTTGNNNSNAAGSSMNPYQWPDLPGYGPPP